MTDNDLSEAMSKLLRENENATVEELNEKLRGTHPDNRIIEQWTEERDESSCSSGKEIRKCATTDSGDGSSHTHCGGWHCK